MKRLFALILVICLLLTGCGSAEMLQQLMHQGRGTFAWIVQDIQNYDPIRPFSQMPVARPNSVPGQDMPPDWRPQHPVLQAILSFAQPILLRLVERKNVRLSVTRHQDQTSWNFSFTEDSNDEYKSENRTAKSPVLSKTAKTALSLGLNSVD